MNREDILIDSMQKFEDVIKEKIKTEELKKFKTPLGKSKNKPPPPKTNNIK